MIDYSVSSPQALETIEKKIRQMQATGANITPEMMQALYGSVLEVGANKALDIAKIQSESMSREADRAEARAERSQVRRDAEKARSAAETRGLGGAIGKMALYGGRYANKKGWLDPLKPWGNKGTPGGTTTPTPLQTVGGQEIGSSPTAPSIMGENPIAEYTNPDAMASLELNPTPEIGGGLPGPITETPIPDLALTSPSVETGGEVSTALSEIGEFGTSTVPEATEALTGTIGEAGSSLGAGSIAGPLGAGSFGYGLTKTLGVNDDIGKLLLFGEGGEKEQDLASGVTTGAATGAIAGTYAFPGIGTAIGGLLGAIGGGVSSMLDDLDSFF